MLHGPQPCQAAQVGQVLHRRAIANQLRAPAQRGAELVQHVQVPAAEVYSDHDEEAEGVEPQLQPASPLPRGAVEVDDGPVVLGGEQSGPRVGNHRLRHEEVGIQGRCQAGGQDQPEWVNVP